MSLVDETVRDFLGSVPRNPDEEPPPRRITTSTSLVSTGETSCTSNTSSVCTGTTSSSYGQVLFCSDSSEGDAFEVIANETKTTSASSDTDTESDDESNDMSLDTSTATYDGMDDDDDDDDDDDEDEVNEDDTDMIDEIAEDEGRQRLLPTVIEEEDEEQQQPYPQHYAVPSNRTSIVPNTDTQECDIRMLVLTESMDGIEVSSVVGHEDDDQSRTRGTVKSDCSTADRDTATGLISPREVVESVVV